MTENDDLGICAPRCPRCGWQAVDRPDDGAGREAAKADVVAHKRECPALVTAETARVERPGEVGIDQHCGNVLIHPGHQWTTSVQTVDEDDHPTDWWEHAEAWCEGNDDQDDPLDRFECCEHCATSRCPRRDGHRDPCRTPDCRPGHLLLGQAEPVSPPAHGEVSRG